MKNFLFLIFCLGILACQPNTPDPEARLKDKLYPGEDHFFDKQFPFSTFSWNAYRDALREVKQFRDFAANRSSGQWVVEGPGNIGARINTIAIHPVNDQIILVGFSEGGIFKTINGGQDWYPVFDDQVKLSIGDITFDVQNPQIVYAGTGDPNISGFPFVGNGLYKSVDGGESWNYLGLSEVGIISQIRVSPDNSQEILVGTMGLPFVKNEHRGLYKSSDGGISWQKILFINDSTGVIDLVMHPTNKNILYATSWNRIRNNKKSLVSGPDGKIFRSVDGGLQWEELTNGLPAGPVSRIGIDISKSNPNILYAAFTHPSTYNLEGIYKSTNGGDTWQPLPIYEPTLASLPRSLYGGFGWYFGKIRINPDNPDDVFILGVDMYRSQDGGLNWSLAVPPWWTYEVHADKHDLVFKDGNIYLATDGGLYKSEVASTANWLDIENIPTTQFYRVAYNPHTPDFYYGGAQDNGSTGGNAASINEWGRIYGGDGFQMAFNPDSPFIFYASSQNGNIVVTEDGGGTFSSGTNGLDPADPRNWDMPYMISAHDADRLYTGTDKVYRTDDVIIPEWTPVSPVLTDPTSEALRKNISSVHESPVDENILYAGTTDGMLWYSPDYGVSWELINTTLPRRYVTSVQASPDNKNTVFVSFSGYRDNDNTPHIFLSENNGKDWVSVQGNLPTIAINSVFVLPGYNDNVIFVGTDAGVFYTKDKGKTWQVLGDNMPMVAVYHLGYNPTENTLVAGTYGRSIQSFDLQQVDLTSSLKPTFVFHDFELHPNPARDAFSITMRDVRTQGRLNGFMSNENGVIVHKFGMDKTTLRLETGQFPPGMYFVTLYSEKGIVTRKITITR